MKSDRLQSDREELAARIEKSMPVDGKHQIRPGLFFYRASTINEMVYGVAEPCLCVITQGSKEVLLGDKCFRYDPAHYLISTMELPVSGRVVVANKQKPYLSLRLMLDPTIVTSVLAESGYETAQSESSLTGIDVGELSENLLDAVLRLVRLLDDPVEYQVLATPTMKEIVFRLLRSNQGSRLRHVAHLGGQSPRIVRAIRMIRDRFDESIRIEDLASALRMSVSSFHSHFKSATSMSPLQFQKQLRLQEARRLLLDENFDAAEAGFRVGYEDAAQFSREYKRHFGLPPKRDVQRMRGEDVTAVQ